MNIIIDNFVFVYNEKNNEAGIICSYESIEKENCFYNYIELLDEHGRKVIIGDPEEDVINTLKTLRSVMIIISNEKSGLDNIKVFDYKEIEVKG